MFWVASTDCIKTVLEIALFAWVNADWPTIVAVFAWEYDARAIMLALFAIS